MLVDTDLFRKVEGGRIHLLRNRIYKKTASIQNKALLFSRNKQVIEAHSFISQYAIQPFWAVDRDVFTAVCYEL